jgi:hypothetical protein
VSSAGVAALYGVVTFALLALALMAALHAALGWPLVPTSDPSSRLHGMVLVAWFCVAALFARAVGQHGARGATLGQAWRAAVGDMGRGLRGLVMR